MGVGPFHRSLAACDLLLCSLLSPSSLYLLVVLVMLLAANHDLGASEKKV